MCELKSLSFNLLMKELHFYIIEYFLNRPVDILRYSTDKERLRPRYIL